MSRKAVRVRSSALCIPPCCLRATPRLGRIPGWRFVHRASEHRQRARVWAVGHVLLLDGFGVPGEQDARRAVGQEDGHGVVVDLGEKTAFEIGGRTYDVRDGSKAPSPTPLADAAPKPPLFGLTPSRPSPGSSPPPARRSAGGRRCSCSCPGG